jgi:hypothetical protein
MFGGQVMPCPCHGSMCACIGTATTSAGGRYDGVAPDATLLSARTNLLATDIFKLYDWVIARKKSGAIPGPVVMSNSYGLYTCSAPSGLPQDHPYRQPARRHCRGDRGGLRGG